MPENVRMRDMQESDRDTVMRIFNHYATASFAAYPNGPLPAPFFAILSEGAISAVVLESEGGVCGFGFLKPFLPFPAFRKTGMLTYFLAPEVTGRGLGNRLLEHLSEDAKKRGIIRLVANMSSKNEASLRFHQRNGFTEAGTLVGIGEKFGQPFDIIWMQRSIE